MFWRLVIYDWTVTIASKYGSHSHVWTTPLPPEMVYLGYFRLTPEPSTGTAHGLSWVKTRCLFGDWPGSARPSALSATFRFCRANQTPARALPSSCLACPPWDPRRFTVSPSSQALLPLPQPPALPCAGISKCQEGREWHQGQSSCSGSLSVWDFVSSNRGFPGNFPKPPRDFMHFSSSSSCCLQSRWSDTSSPIKTKAKSQCASCEVRACATGIGQEVTQLTLAPLPSCLRGVDCFHLFSGGCVSGWHCPCSETSSRFIPKWPGLSVLTQQRRTASSAPGLRGDASKPGRGRGGFCSLSAPFTLPTVSMSHFTYFHH